MGNQKETKIARILMNLGSAPNTKGFHYLKAGISYCFSSPESITNLTRIIYPYIAQKFGTTEAAVERAARHSIKTGWHRRSKELAEEIFGNTLQSENDVPSNGLFIAGVAEYLQNTE